MRRIAVRGLLAFALLSAGYTIGRAQVKQPDFEISVSSPAGETIIECRRGCGLKWISRGILEGEPQPTFKYSCAGATVQRCGSGIIGGWIQ